VLHKLWGFAFTLGHSRMMMAAALDQKLGALLRTHEEAFRQPGGVPAKILYDRTLRFIHGASNVTLLGPPDVGKTHLAVALAEAAIRAGQPAYFKTAHDLVSDLGKAYREGRLGRQMRIYLARRLVGFDEMGFLPMDGLGATIFFQLVSARYERTSILLTSNKNYGDWGPIFGDPIIATAILDRPQTEPN
jgi:DNA replication protein DnaC